MTTALLRGLGLPGAWADESRWTILSTGFGWGHDFLHAWRAWKADAHGPRLLHFVGLIASAPTAGALKAAVANDQEIVPLADQLAAQWWGLLPGFHRLTFEDGSVLLTLCVGDAAAALKQLHVRADSIVLGAQDEDASLARSAARLARRGTRVAGHGHVAHLRKAMTETGFRIDDGDDLRGVFDPSWEPRHLAAQSSIEPGTCAVVGGGLAGSAVAASLARRGWHVDVLDEATSPAAGASGLPAGLLAPHQSPDDSLLSRLSRAGVRMTLQQAEARLERGRDWQLTGVLERRNGDGRPPPHESEWTRQTREGDWWHEKAAWIRPGALVESWLATPGVTWRGGERVSDATQLRRSYDLVVVAAAHASGALLGDTIAVHPVRGQVSWGMGRVEGAPLHPVNGNGHFIALGDRWTCGSTYGRGETTRDLRMEDHAANFARLQVLLPVVAKELEATFSQAERPPPGGGLQGWAGVRCASADRRPLVGPLGDGLWVSTAMGSRGLTFCALAAELIAARLHGEPWPVEERLGTALDAMRARRWR